MEPDFIPLENVMPPGQEDKSPFPSQGENDGVFASIGKSLVHGFLNVAGGFVGNVEEAVELLPGVDETNYFTGIYSNIRAEQRKWEANPASITGKVAKIIGSAIPYMGAALAGGMYLGPVGAASVALAVEGQDAYDTAKQRGATETEANIERIAVGSINAAIEALQIGRLMKFSKTAGMTIQSFKNMAKDKLMANIIKSSGRFTADVLKTSIEEAMEEALQQGVSLAVPYLVEGKDALPLKPDGSIDTWAILSEIGEAALAGAVVSPFLGVAKAAVPALVAPSPDSFNIIRKTILDMPNQSNEWKAARLYDLQIQQNEIFKQEQQDKSVQPSTDMDAIEQSETLSAKDKTQIASYLSFLNDLSVTAKEVAKARPLHEEEISRRKAAKLHEADEWAKANSHLVEEGKMTRDEFGATYAQLLTGRLTPEFEFTLRPGMDAAIQDAIRRTIPTDSYQFIEAQAAWLKLSRELVLPERSEIKALEPVIGTELVKTFLDIHEKHRRARRSLARRLVDNLTEIANFPRATVASMDLSFIGLQGIKVAVRHPKKGLKTIAAGWRAFLNPQNLKLQQLMHRTHPGFEHVVNVMKVKYYAEHSSDTDERFMSRLGQAIPGIKASERGWVAAANELRMQLALEVYEKYKYSNLSRAQWEELGAVINHLTGYGDAKSLKHLMPILNFLFFSPRSNLANVQLLHDLHPVRIVRNKGRLTPAQKILISTLVTDAVFYLGILTLLATIPGVTVERDPRSNDFNKVKIGDTRFELFGNDSRMIRLIAQLLSGQIKSQAGHFSNLERVDIITRYLQSKAAPIVGFGIDLLKGHDYLGRPLGDTPEEISEQVYSRFAPLFLQDMLDYIKSNGLDMDIFVAAPLAFHGVTTMTYPMSKASQATMYKDQKAREIFGKNWSDLGPSAWKQLRQVFPAIVELELMAKKEKEEKTISTQFLKEQRKSEKRLMNSFSYEVQDELNRLLVDVGGFNRRIGDGWVLNDQRYAEYQFLTAKLLQQTLPKLIRLNINPLVKRVIIEDHIDKIKQLVRRKIVYSADISDLQSIRRK